MKQLSAMDFSGDVGGYGFGTDAERTAAVLRQIADAIDAQELLLQSARLTSLAGKDDFTLTSVRLVLAPKHDVPGKIVELRGSEGPFPEAVAQS